MKIFVYGSLREGFYNFDIYIHENAKKIEMGEIKGKLYAIKDKEYPALLEGEETVKGEIITLKDCDIESMDSMENYFGENNPNNEYNKVLMDIKNLETGEIEKLNVYVYNTTNPDFNFENLTYIPSGDWKEYKNS
ncbi:MAG: gamma-glutamylcyclotransferase family protein [Cetobacterium sp.]|uniref:gamma-glutamylcyclotransferase family protein n=1 Tax=unclassified Cetobacterium TaxID=2630983 RepID=UPI00163BE2D8|nr:gamma-glutamylcyclotransferase family protein [Cetobacterium sp. 2A]MBC2856761.1 gamma-glutamylcyclotransferase [Cetobacterium sp. 2A]